MIENGEVTYRKCYGLARLDTAAPFRTSTKTRIASISKQFTTACILLLREKGLLQLGTTYQLSVRDGDLNVDIDGPGGSRSYPSLQRVARDSFLMDNQSEGQVVLWFRRDSLGRVECLLVSGARAQGLVFERRKAKREAQHANQ